MRPEISEIQTRQIKKVTWIGCIVNVALAAVKFAVGTIGSSQAVIADAVHSLSDLATDFSVILGVQYWSAPPDDDHPYGHGRIEAIITALIGLALVSVAFGLGYKAVCALSQPHARQTTWIALIGPLLSIVLKEILYHWTIIVGTRVRSTAVVANAWHHRSDALSSIPAIIAVVMATINPAWFFVDHLGALIISVFILKVSWDILRPSLAELADHGASENERALIRKIATDIKGVKGVHAIRTRKYGESLYVDLHILVDPAISVSSGHDISETVKKALLEKGPRVLDVVTHLEPGE